MHRIAKIRRLSHVVLLVAAQAVLRAKRGRDIQPANRAQRVERMFEFGGHRRGVREQRHAPAFELALQIDVGEQAIDTELNHVRNLQVDDEAVGMVEIGFLRQMLERPV